MKRILTFPLTSSISMTLTFAFIAMTASAAIARDGSRNRGYGFLMLEEPVGSRNAAMGSVGAALGGPGFRYYNPALPFFSGSSFAAAEFGRMPGDVTKGGVESALIFPKWFSVISLHSSAVDFQTRDERGFGADASSVTTIGALGAGYIRGDLALAVSANMTEDRIGVSSDYGAVALGAGLGYRLLDGRLNLGAAGFHGLAWSKGRGTGGGASAWRGGQVPRFARAGAAWTDTLKSLPYTIAADAVYRDEDGTFTAPLGLEVSVLPYISLRIGKRIGWDNEIVSLGIGFHMDRLSFDAAFIPTTFVDEYEMKWSMGFSYGMGGDRGDRRARRPPATAEPPPESTGPEPER